MHGLVAVDDDARRVAAALVGVAQLDAPAAHHRRLVLHHRALERLAELRGRDLGHRGVVGLDGGSDELADAGAVARRDEVLRNIGDEIELEREQTADLLALLHRDAVPFVDGDDERAAALQREAEHARILLADAVVSIDHEHHHMRGIDGLQGLGDARLLDRVLDLAAAAHAGGVDERELAAIARERHEDAVAGGAGHVAGDDAVLADQSVDERRLAHVRATDDGDTDAAVVGRGGGGERCGVVALEHALHEIAAALAVRGGDGQRLAEAERMEIGGGGRRIETLGLVDREEHGLAGAAQLTRHEVVLRREPAACIGDEDEQVGFLDGTLGLQAHRLLDAGGLLDEAAGVDHHIRHRAEPAVAVLAVTGDARHVGDERIARAGEAVEERGLADIRSTDQRHDGQQGVHGGGRHSGFAAEAGLGPRGRNALTRPSSSCTTRMPSATRGALVTRPPALPRATKAPVSASIQCR